MKFILFLLGAIPLATSMSPAAQSGETSTNLLAIKAGRLMDVAGGRFLERQIIIAVTGNPVEDITVLERVGFVMKGGVVWKDSRRGK